MLKGVEDVVFFAKSHFEDEIFSPNLWFKFGDVERLEKDFGQRKNVLKESFYMILFTHEIVFLVIWSKKSRNPSCKVWPSRTM